MPADRGRLLGSTAEDHSSFSRTSCSSVFSIDIARSHAARLAWDSLLCLVFFLQHSGMIRRSAKERIDKWVRVPGDLVIAG